MKQFDGASVLVTGGSRGIGREIALTFAERGAGRVAIGYMRSDRAAEETAAELRDLGAEPILVRGNVASSRVADQVAELGLAGRARPQRSDGRDPSCRRGGGQALRLDDVRERARPDLARPRRRHRR